MRIAAIRAIRLILAVFAVALAMPAFAQLTSTYVADSTGAINASTACSDPLVRTFYVGGSFTVSDVDIGILIQHAWRGDIRLVLQSPNGTRVRLTDGNTSSLEGDNFNVLLDDDAGQLVNTDGLYTYHPLGTVPPFANTFRPNSPLSAFNGEPANGTWRLEICDLFPNADNGEFRYAELYLTAPNTKYADLSLTKVLVGAPPVQGGTASWRLTVTNATNSTDTATNITVRDTLPSGFTFAAATGSGSFNAATGDWTVPPLAPGQSAIMTITGTVTRSAGNTLTNTAQIMASSIFDPDSTPGNSATSEDDYDSATFTVQSGRPPGTPPSLPCTAGTSIFDWDAISGWNPGTTNASLAFANYGNVGLSMDNGGGYFVWDATYGGQSPTVSNAITGGLNPAEQSLHIVANHWNSKAEATITITLPRAFSGVQFSIFNVDFRNNWYADRLVVTGTNGTTPVSPTLSNGNVNYLSGGEIIADGYASDDEATGNVVVTFTQPVTTINIRLGNHTTAPNNPRDQAIALHDITVCVPATTLSVTKVSSVISDPVNGTSNPKAIPGALIEYLVTVTNTGAQPADANSVLVRDDGPADAKLCRISTAGGPVTFANGTPSSGLSYAFTSPGSGTDGLEFSSNGGASWAYVPSADGDGCDPAVNAFRVRPSGTFAAGGTFTLRIRYQVE